jgi:hypothetical protein
VVAALGCGWLTAIRLFGHGDVRPGSAAVYARIDAETDCEILQDEFDTAQANHKQDLARGAAALDKIDTSYVEAANARMRELGCTDNSTVASPGPSER